MQKAMDKFSAQVVEIMAKNTNLENQIRRYSIQLRFYASQCMLLGPKA